MTLQLSGILEASDINVELGRAATATFSITDAATGVYGAINTCSPYYPNGTVPHAYSEWYGYNHLAVCSYSTHSLDVSKQNITNFIYGDDWSGLATAYPVFEDGGFTFAFWVQMASSGVSTVYLTSLAKVGTAVSIIIAVDNITSPTKKANLTISLVGTASASWTAQLNSTGNTSNTGIATSELWGNGSSSESIGSVNANNFAHIAVSYDGSQTEADCVKIYWNGQSLDLSFTGDDLSNVTWSDQFLTVGGSYPSELSSGCFIDDYVFYYRDTLTETEIAEIYNSGEPQAESSYSFSYDNVKLLFEDEPEMGLDSNSNYNLGNVYSPPAVQSTEHA